MRPVLKWEGPEAEKNPIHLTQVKKNKTEFGENLKHQFEVIEAQYDPHHFLNLQQKELRKGKADKRQPSRKSNAYKFSSSKKFKIKQIKPFSKSKRNFKARSYYNWDVNHKIGESSKHLKKSILRRMEAYQADNLKRLGTENEVLRKTMEEHRRIEK